MVLNTAASISFSQINSTAYFTNGNLGINTTNPSANLDVAGTINASGLASLSSITTGTISASGLSALANTTATNVSTGVLIASTGITTGTISASGLSALTNTTATNVSTGVLIASTGITTGTISASGLSALSNITATNMTSSTLIATSVSSGLLSATNVIGNSISAGTLIATTITGGTTSLSGNLNIAGALTTVNITSTNLVQTNVSTGTIYASGTSTLQNVTATNITVGTSRITSNLISIGNSNTIGSLYTTGGNVGVGTTSPSYTLDVNGAGRVLSNFYVGSGSGAGVLHLWDIPGAAWQIGTGGYNLSIGNGTIGGAINTRMTISSTGNIGIGTTSPSYALDIVNTTARLVVRTSANGDGQIYFGNSNHGVGRNASMGTLIDGNDVGLWTAGTGSIGFVTSGVERMRVSSSSGNIGIGTASPSAKLHVVGTVTADGVGAESHVFGSSNSGTNHSMFLYSSIGYAEFGISGGTGFVSPVNAGDAFFRSQVGKGIVVQGNGGSGSYVYVASAGIGINTASPSYTLDVNGTCKVSDKLYVGTESGVGTIFMGGGSAGDPSYNDSVIETRQYGGSQSSEMVLFKAADIAGSFGPDRIRLRAAAIAFDTYPADTTNRTAENIRMYINDSGNVGIGTTSPSANLTVFGTATISSGKYIANKLLTLYDHGVTDDYTNTTNFYGFGINNGTLRYQVPTGGFHRFFGGVIEATNQLNIAGPSGTLDPTLYGGLQVTMNDTDINSVCPHVAFIRAGNSVCFFTVNTSNQFVMWSGSGGVYLSNGGTSWSAISDRNMKTDFQDITTPLDKLVQIKGLYYRYLTDNPDTKRVGVIAQDVQSVLPEAVTEDSDGILGVSYTELIPLVTESCKELKSRNDDLELEYQHLHEFIQSKFPGEF